ncbi:MAG: hypothetical protein KDD36_12575 [Flavobacteriales bacterium]|nr:hypothetical protein [Flavobacteriales bacterium]
MTIAGMQTQQVGPEHKFKFQGQELQDDFGLNWYGFKWRNHDPSIARFFGVDPLAEKYVYNSVYAFQENKLGLGTELEGRELDFLPWLTAEVATNPDGPVAATAGFAMGVGKHVENSVEGIGNMVAHPIETLDNMSALANPLLNPEKYSQFAVSMGMAATEKINIMENGTAFEQGMVVGEAAAFVGEMILVSKGVGALTKGAEGAAVMSEVSESTTQTVFRVFGADARAEGFSWTPTNPTSIPNFRNVAGLPSGGASGATNSAEFMVTGQVKPTNIIQTRPALPLDGNVGGLPEYIIDPKNVTLTDFSVLKP